MRSSPFLLMASLIFLCGCRLGPQHHVPEMQIEDDWNFEEGEVFSHHAPLPLEALFDDPLLLCYLNGLERENPDLRIAQIRILEAYTQRDITAAKRMPRIDMRVNQSGSKPAGGVLNSGLANSSSPSIGLPLLLKQTSFLADFDALWEIDLFGKIAREVEGDTAMIGKACASYDFTLLSLKSECARIYFELRKNQEFLRLTREQTAFLERKRKLSHDRLIHGIDSENVLLQVENLLAEMKAQIPNLESSILEASYQLAVLLGKTPQTLLKELEEPQHAIPEIKGSIPVGFPSELLRRRPDVRMAERDLAKASADVGVAIAQLFPQLTLNGTYGYQKLSIGTSKGEGKSWSYSGGLLTPLFHGGALRANIDLSQWARQEAFLNYENSVLKALEEAEGSIARFTASQKALEQKQNALKKEERLLVHTRQLFQAKLSNELPLLDQEQEILNSRRDLISQRTTVATNLVALYKALGGGFCAE